jgi:hypothetical protein
MASQRANFVTLGPQTAAALGTVNGVRGRKAIIKIVTSGVETVSVTGEVVPGQASSQIMWKSLATGALHSSVSMDDGTYYLDFVYTDTLVFLGSGAADTKTVHIAIFD